MVRWTKLHSKILGAALLAGGAFAQACTSSNNANPGSCVDNPNTCAAGTTCWPKDCAYAPGDPQDSAHCTPNMQCLPSVPGKNLHDICNNTIGKVTCGDHQACVEINAGFGGCLLYCDPAKPNNGCPAFDGGSETCVDLKVGQTDQSPTIHVCAVVNPLDAGEGGAPDDGPAIFDVRTEFPM